MSGPLTGPEDMKSSIDRQTRTSLEHHRQAQDRLGSMDRADDGRRGHKNGTLGHRLSNHRRHVRSDVMATDRGLEPDETCNRIAAHMGT